MALTKLPQLAEIQTLSQSVIRILGCNPSNYTLQGTNSYLIGKGPKRILLDTTSPGDAASSYCNNLKKVLLGNSVSISTLLISHWHHDHIGAVKDVLKLCADLGFDKPSIHKFPSSTNPDEEPLEDISIVPLVDKEVFQPDSDTSLEVLFLPGHSDDHACFWLEKENVLFTGDLILGHGSGVFQNLTAFMTSLKICRSLEPKSLYPGHGDVPDCAKTKIQEQIDHRETRIRQVEDGLKAAGENGVTETQLVGQIYPQLPPDLYMGALSNLKHALGYLADSDIAKSDDSEDTRWFYAVDQGSKL